MKIIAIIPARGGSKRIPHKNIKLYNGFPLIYWSISLALKSTLINEVIVSTDSDYIGDIAMKYGAKVILRSREISQDLSTDYEFIKEYLDKTDESERPDLIVQLRPTYPNRTLEILNHTIETFLDNYEYDSLRTICPTNKPPFKMYVIEKIEPKKSDSKEILKPLFNQIEINKFYQDMTILKTIKEPYNMPAQILPKTYWHNGYIDIIKVDAFIKNDSISGNNIYPYMMDPLEIDDIDTEEEWIESERKIKI